MKVFTIIGFFIGTVELSIGILYREKCTQHEAWLSLTFCYFSLGNGTLQTCLIFLRASQTFLVQPHPPNFSNCTIFPL